MKRYTHKPFEKYKGDHCKFYIEKFTKKNDKKGLDRATIFHKFGVTTFKNAEDRFKVEPKQYEDYDIKISCTIICETKAIAEEVESFFKQKYPKNINLVVEDHKHMPKLGFSGITEIHQCGRPGEDGSWQTVYADYLQKKGEYACQFKFPVK